MTTYSRAFRLWPVMAAGVFALGVAAGLGLQPEAANRLAQSDCLRAKEQERKRHDWGWNVFNHRTETPSFWLNP